jgi:hypothetical protein
MARAEAKFVLHEAINGRGALGKASTNQTTVDGRFEPVFVLRGQDEIAAPLVGLWIAYAIKQGVNQKKIDEAIKIAEEFNSWSITKKPD